MRNFAIALLATAFLAAAAEARLEPATVSGEEVVRQARQALQPTAGTELRPLSRPGSFDAPATPGWRTRVLRPVGSGRPSVRVEALLDGRVLRTFTLTFDVLEVRPVLVATRALLAGEVFDPSAFRLERVAATPGEDVLDLAGLPHGPLKVRRNLVRGDRLRARHLEQLPTVVRGQAIQVVEHREGITLHLEATAREPGFPGRSFRVKTESGRTMTVWAQPDGTATTEPAFVRAHEEKR